MVDRDGTESAVPYSWIHSSPMSIIIVQNHHLQPMHGSDIRTCLLKWNLTAGEYNHKNGPMQFVALVNIPWASNGGY